MSKLQEAAADHDLLAAGVELGYLSAAQIEDVIRRQADLRRGGMQVHASQVLLERRFLNPSQLSQIGAELKRRHALETDGVERQPEVPIRSFGPYEVLAVLSESGRARVLKARDKTMDRLVVLKVLPPNLAKDEQWSERFRREVQTAGKLSHPNIITAYGSCEVDGCPVLAMEYLEAMSLEERLEREGNLPEKTAWLVAREVAKGLAHAWQHGVLHRDIKPDNIICTADGKVKIIDMGLSKSMSEDTALTAPGTTVGTPFYISPEQAHGNKDLDIRTDIYSLGCALFHMVTGSVPFMGESLIDVMLKHTQAPRPDPRSLLPEISAGTATLIMRMMALKPDDRPATPEALIAEIGALLPTLPEPEDVVRPAMKVERSNTVVMKRDGPPSPLPKTAAPLPRPSRFTRLVDWFINVFD
ncbi:MAG: serine/threonine-protein kinase [Planctomycetota bacterium]|nr:serine/threonine-protein kinase [Planctomycetota bacterium]